VVVLLLLPAAAGADEAAPLRLCLAPHADESPCYPLGAVPSTNREMIVVFRLRAGESFPKIEHVWTALDVGDVAPANTVIAKAELSLGNRTSGVLRCSMPNDLPVGKYRLDVSAEGKPWASLDIAVAPSEEAAPLPEPADLVPLEPGTTWEYSWLLEPGPKVKGLTVQGAEQDADGKFRARMTIAVAAKEDGLARMELKRNDALVSEEWWSLADTGLAVTRVRSGGETAPYDPPLPMIALPLRSPHRWSHQPKDAPPTEYRMWGPLPVRTPVGDAKGWIVWMKTRAGPDTLTVERHFAPGVGVVREVHVTMRGQDLVTRMETGLLPAR